LIRELSFGKHLLESWMQKEVHVRAKEEHSKETRRGWRAKMEAGEHQKEHIVGDTVNSRKGNKAIENHSYLGVRKVTQDLGESCFSIEKERNKSKS
jgi:hypothetical protein